MKPLIFPVGIDINCLNHQAVNVHQSIADWDLYSDRNLQGCSDK